jgi:hypothetical protein
VLTSLLAIAPRTSLPSEEHAGALPGEHSSGAGALPGKNTESGVAVLPDEKSEQSLQNDEMTLTKIRARSNSAFAGEPGYAPR